MLPAGADRHTEEGNTNPTLPYTTEQESQRNLVGSEKKRRGRRSALFLCVGKITNTGASSKATSLLIHETPGGSILTDFRYDDTYAEYLLAQLKQRVTQSDHLSLPLQQEQGNETVARSDQEAGARIQPFKKSEAVQDKWG